ncbi:MAG: tetratricopeptide repeat protein, partial [Desulfobacterales bacterium]|nr:tetratricopeptide repeat protein [Desulfobacterales bacterium]
AAYKSGDFELAQGQFARVVEGVNAEADGELRQNALFNLANTQYRLGNLDSAIQTYEKLLSEFPDDSQAKENLEFVKQKKGEQEQKKNSQNSQGDDSKGDQGDSEKGESESNGDSNADSKSDDSQDRDGDSGQQSPSGNGQNRDKQNGETGEQGDSGKQSPSPEKNNDSQLDSQDGKSGGKDPGPPPMPKPDSPEEKAPAGVGREDSGGENPKDARAGEGAAMQRVQPGGEHMDTQLNRLEDKPGMALIPVGDAREIEKDW